MDKKTIKSYDMRKLSEYVEYLRGHPRLTYLFLELTSSCNLHCRHCGSGCGGKAGMHLDTEMLFNALETVAEDFDSSSIMVCITGGEPMLHPDFRAVVSKVVELGFPWGMTTNGTLIDSDDASFFKSQGIGSITVSIDGLENSHDELRQVKGSWKKSVNAVQLLQDSGIPVQVTSVIHRGNYSELEEIYELMCRLKVNSWRVINIEPIGRALENRDMLLNNEEFDGLIDFIREKRYSEKTPLDVRFGCSHYLSLNSEREVRDNYFICGSGIMVGSILCNGDIYSCLDIERRPELVQGNIWQDRFSDVWYSRFREFREDRSAMCNECRHCSERSFCRGDSGHTWDYSRNRPMFCILRKGNYYGDR